MTSTPTQIRGSGFFGPSTSPPVPAPRTKYYHEKVHSRPSPKPTFLQVYPTSRLRDEELQCLLPRDWSPTCVHDYRHFGLVRVPLPPGYECVVHSLNLQMGGRTVKGIEKVENPYQFMLYQLKIMESEGSQEMVLFHGTGYANVVSIARDNFNWRLAGNRVGHRHGLGVYFTSSVPFCLKFAKKDRCFLVAKVLVGAISRGTADTRLPGPSTDATGDGRHTIVKYHDHEFYPQYVVHF